MKQHILLITCLFLLPITILAHSEPPQDLGVVSKEYLDSSIAVLNKVGTYDALQVTSSLPDGADQKLALTYTKQGIALHHAFQWEDAVRSFNEALRLDDRMVRAHLGKVVASMNLLGPNDDKSFMVDHLQDAAKAALQVSNNEVDRLWVDVYAIYIPASLGLNVKIAPVSAVGKTLSGSDNAKLSSLITTLAQTYNDPEAYAFAGWDLQSVNFLEQGEKLFPTHTGILHYLTHIRENSGSPEHPDLYQQAADFAKRVVDIAPDAPHLVHMYGHILPLLGKWDEANKYFLRAHCIHRATLAIPDALCTGLSFQAPLSAVAPGPRELWHYGHNLELFGFSLMRTRDIANAERIFTDLCTAGNCSSVVQFYLGEGMYGKAENFVNAMVKNVSGNSANPLLQMKVQALVADKKVTEAQTLFNQTNAGNTIEGFASVLSIAWATNSVTPGMQTSLTGWLQQSTANPNFDVWSHTLPVLRKLHRIAKEYGAQEEVELYNAIQRIDPGHPF
jgi:tetratricopeptide (TPR) repeat protein